MAEHAWQRSCTIKVLKSILVEGALDMRILSKQYRLAVFAAVALLVAGAGLAGAQTVVFKQAPAGPGACTYDVKLFLAKIEELKNVNAQLANRAKMLEIQVAAIKVVNVKRHKSAQYCKRWKHHRCTWLARR